MVPSAVPFRNLAGHRHLTTLLGRAIARDTLPPAMLFAGPQGVGKWRAALATAEVLNCLEPADGDACGRCRSCDRIARGVHVDVIAVEPDDRASIKIDIVRDLLQRTAFRPFEGRRRVVLVRDADRLETSAQNALLKSLEEPPPGTVFILVTSVPGALLSTVRSRTVRLRFGRLTAAEVASVLVAGHGFDERGAREAAALADGSVGRALASRDEDLGALGDLAVRLLHETAGKGDVQRRLQAAASLISGLPRKDDRQDLAAVLRLAASMLRDVEVLHAGADRGLLANPAIEGDLERLSRTIGGDRARAAHAAVDRALVALGRNAGTKLVAEWVAVQL